MADLLPSAHLQQSLPMSHVRSTHSSSLNQYSPHAITNDDHWRVRRTNGPGGRKFHASNKGVEEADEIQTDASILPRTPIDQLVSNKIPICIRSIDHLVQRWRRRRVIYRRRDTARVYSVTSVQK